MLRGVRIVDEMRAVFHQLGAEVGAFEACEPEGAGRDGRVGAADHLKFKVGDDVFKGRRGMRKKGAVAEASELLRAEERKDDGAARTGAGGGARRQGEA